MKSVVTDYLRLIRLPGALGIALTPVFGAISLVIISLSVLLPLLLIGFFSKIYGFVLNDYMDVSVDRLSKELSQRALVKGTVSKHAALLILLVCFFAAYLAIFIFFYRNTPTFFYGLICIILADVLGLIYNIYGKRFVGSDFFIALAEAFLFLFGAFMVFETGALGVLTWVLFILIILQVFYENAIEGGLKDVDHDFLRGVKNIALVSGVRVTEDKNVFIPLHFQLIGIGVGVLSVFVLFVPFIFYNIHYELWQISVLIVIVAVVLIQSIRMLLMKHFDRNKLRRLISSGLFFRYSIVPILLVSFVGVLYAVVLIMLPLVWYLFFSVLIGEKLFEPEF